MDKLNYADQCPCKIMIKIQFQISLIVHPFIFSLEYRKQLGLFCFNTRLLPVLCTARSRITDSPGIAAPKLDAEIGKKKVKDVSTMLFIH